MSSKKIQDLPLKNPLDAMKIPTGGFGDYAVTVKTVLDYFLDKYNIVQEDDINALEASIQVKLDAKVNKNNVYTKEEIDGLIALVNGELSEEIVKNLVLLENLDNELQGKANSSDVYLKTETYSQQEVDTNLDSKIKIVDDKLTEVDEAKIESVNGKTGKSITLARDDVGVPTDAQIKAFEKEDKYVITESGRTQREKNKDFITPLDYKAKFDGVTDDTQAFTDLELEHQGRVVDLLNKTYLVSSYPRANKYVNGKFLRSGIEYYSEYNIPYNKQGVFASAGALLKRSYNPVWTDSIVAIGNRSMENMEDIRTSIAIGSRTISVGTKSRDNIAIGDSALQYVQARTSAYDQSQKQGTRNIAIGGTAGVFIYEGYGNTVVGRGAGQCLKNGNSNVGIGAGALGGSAPVGLTGEIENPFPMNVSDAVAIGTQTLHGYQGTDPLVSIGSNSLSNARLLSTTVAIGANAGSKLDAEIASNGKTLLWSGTQSGTYTQTANTLSMTFSSVQGAVVGCFVGIRLLDGDSQTLQGDIVYVEVISISGTTINVNHPISRSALGTAQLREVYSTANATTQSGASTLVGQYVMQNSSRAYRTVAIGTYTAEKAVGNSSALVGYAVGRNSDSVTFSCAFGNLAMNASANYASCIAIGSGSLGVYTDGTAITGTLSGAVAIGTNATVSGNNEIQLGASTQTTYVYGTVQNRSDERDKADIRDTKLGLDFINSLRPVDYKWDMREDYVENEVYFEDEWQAYPLSDTLDSSDIGLETKVEDGVRYILRKVEKMRTIKHEKDGSKKRERFHHGFIAQEVPKDFGGYQDHKINGGSDVLSLGYDEFIAPLVKAMQELSKEVEKLKIENSELKQKLIQ